MGRRERTSWSLHVSLERIKHYLHSLEHHINDNDHKLDHHFHLVKHNHFCLGRRILPGIILICCTGRCLLYLLGRPGPGLCLPRRPASLLHLPI